MSRWRRDNAGEWNPRRSFSPQGLAAKSSVARGEPNDSLGGPERRHQLSRVASAGGSPQGDAAHGAGCAGEGSWFRRRATSLASPQSRGPRVAQRAPIAAHARCVFANRGRLRIARVCDWGAGLSRRRARRLDRVRSAAAAGAARCIRSATRGCTPAGCVARAAVDRLNGAADELSGRVPWPLLDAGGVEPVGPSLPLTGDSNGTLRMR